MKLHVQCFLTISANLLILAAKVLFAPNRKKFNYNTRILSYKK